MKNSANGRFVIWIIGFAFVIVILLMISGHPLKWPDYVISNPPSMLKESSSSTEIQKDYKEINKTKDIHTIRKQTEEFKNDPFAVLLSKQTTPPFDHDFKNPCWWTGRENSTLTCLPYFYLAGVTKSGTTDLYARLLRHPMFAEPLQKEPHHLNLEHFKAPSSCSNETLKYAYTSCKIYNYATSFFKKAVYRIQNVHADSMNRSVIVKDSRHKYKYPFITVDASAETVWDNRRGYHIIRDIPMSYQVMQSNASIWDWIIKMNPNVKVVVILREPVSRVYSGYNYFIRDTTPAKFDKLVEESIERLNNCSRDTGWSAYMCALNNTKDFNQTIRLPVRLHVSMYHDYLKDLLLRIPRSKMHVIRTEDYHKDTKNALHDMFQFLDLPELKDEALQAIVEAKQRNVNKKRVERMWPSTRKRLIDYFKPYNQKLANLLNNEAFLWQDIYKTFDKSR